MLGRDGYGGCFCRRAMDVAIAHDAEMLGDAGDDGGAELLEQLDGLGEEQLLAMGQR